jgi:hypothetical protein
VPATKADLDVSVQCLNTILWRVIRGDRQIEGPMRKEIAHFGKRVSILEVVGEPLIFCCVAFIALNSGHAIAEVLKG